MKNRKIRSLASLFILLLITSFAGEDSSLLVAAQNPVAATRRTLPRKYDYIKVKGEFLRSMCGVAIERLSILASKDGKLSPIPFQIDERDRKGHYIMKFGKTAGKDEDNGALDANDELVFMVSDAGDRLPSSELAGRLEIEITDPRNLNQRAWAYLARYDSGKTPRSTVDYVTYDPKAERVISDRYILGYRKGYMFYNDLIYPTSNGGNGKDFMDRIKVRIRVEFFKGKMNIQRSEDDVRAEVQGWIDGPVRVVQCTINYVKVFDMFPPISFNSMSEYYSTLTASPITVKFPFNLNMVMKTLGINTITADVYGDHFGMVGGRGYTSLSPEGFDYTGHMTPEIYNKIPKKGIVYGFATKKGVGTWFPRVVFPDPMYQFNEYYITDDVALNKPPDDVPGEIGGGIHLDVRNYPPKLRDWISGESFMMKFETYFAPSGITSAEAKEWLDIQDYPLLVAVHGGEGAQAGTSAKKPGAGPPWKGGCNGAIVDVFDRKIPLKGIAFFVGDIDVDPRSYFPGERMSDGSIFAVPLTTVKTITNYTVEYDPRTKLHNAMCSKLILTNGSILDLIGCRACGWAGADEEGRVVYFSNAQIQKIEFDH